MVDFDPNGVGKNGSLFGLPYSADEADIVILPVPWDVTVSYTSGTAKGPNAILTASPQIDYSIPGIKDPWRLGIHMLSVSDLIKLKSGQLRTESREYIEWLENNEGNDPIYFEQIRKKVNHASEELNAFVKTQAKNYLNKGKIVATLGGDHSTPLGLIEALSEVNDNFGILQIDAHMDLREAYEGFEFSHASIMYNSLKYNNITKLVQVAIRDFCDAETELVTSSKERVKVFYDQEIKEGEYTGKNWSAFVDEIIKNLPQQVYISFDIDGLNPVLCPETGTPVPGGLSYNQATYLIKKVAQSGRKIIGFDLSEVAPDDNEWNANVGARMLYQLCVYCGVSQGRLSFNK
ncbi:MAG: agmatinase family protein [Cyclobacteriaceae bacterium]